MGCNTFITLDISECGKAPVKGLKSKAWIFNRADIASWTGATNTYSALTRVAGKKAFKVEGFKDFMNAGSSAAIGEDKANKYKHMWSVILSLATPAERANIDVADDVVVIVESNNGEFKIFGRKNGLWKSAQEDKANDNVGRTTTTFESRADMEEVYSADYFFDTNYATTLAKLISYETA